MARRKRLCMISSEAKNEHQHDEAQGRSNGHSTNDTNDANSSQMDTTTNEHSDNHNELGGPPKKVRGPTQKKELWNMHKNKILSSMGKKLNACRNLVKSRNYDPTLSVEEIMVRQTHSRVNPEQFQHLVNRWMKPEYQRIGRSKMKEPHVTGTKSFARLAEEEVTKNNGVQLTRRKLYQKSRTRTPNLS